MADFKQTVAELERRLQASLAERDELLQQQAATNEVLQVINASSGDLAPVFDAILERAMRLCEAQFGLLASCDNGQIRTVAARGVPPAFAEFRKNNPPDYGPETGPARILAGERVVHIADLKSGDAYRTGDPNRRAVVDLGGARTVLLVPLLKTESVLGYITVYRKEVRPYSDKQIVVLQNFADQAVIAIENVRLFNETREALERQTATADILKVIANSPTNLQPVFNAIAERSNRLIRGHATAVIRFVGDVAELAAFTSVSPEADAALQAAFPVPVTGQLEQVRNGEVREVADTESETLTGHSFQDLARARGFRSRILVPLKGEKGIIGAIGVTRKEPGGFADHHVQLLKTFADQAVIAISNVELFEQLQARTSDLQESLHQQTATSEVLEVISSSIGDVQPVFEKMLESATRVCGAHFGAMGLFDGEVYRRVALYNVPPAFDAAAPKEWRPGPEGPIGRVLRTGQVHRFDDLRENPNYLARHPATIAMVEIAKARTLVSVPMLRDGRPIGVISIYRQEVRPFSDKQVDLLKNFASQAVIAIENARLFNETREALERQTATADVLKVIASSPSDVQPVFDAIAASANRLLGGFSSTVFRFIDGVVHLKAFTPTTPEADEILQSTFPRPVADFAPFQMTQAGEVMQIPDTEAPTYELKEIARARGYRSMLYVPLMNKGASIGFIAVTRVRPGAFADHHVQLLQTFADQAVIAIQNVRMFNEVQDRTHELSQSLDDLRTAQDRLVQTEKLASLGQLTAGIAHEIKNPLNFVNNFSALSAELSDELNELLKRAALTDKMREEVDELTRLLKDNLEKVVQHGKRADSIVKNMLLHSREGSREHRPADINSLLDESLNLAYHGARAEKPGFNITLRRNFDADAGSVDLFPQEITRAFLNLISNSFYAASKRKTEKAESDFEPILSASTKNLGSTVEIRIRDNGNGIPGQVQEKMFNPFFTTKPAGEGTGLGLSMTHDIIVKQHGGRIDVATEPGQFTEFTIVLPRKSNVSGRDRGET